MISERAGNTENHDFKLRNRGTQRFMITSGRVPTGKDSIFSRMPKFFEPNYGHNLHLMELF